MSFEFTPSQSLAIESRGSSVLVSAAAGSGKTRVLTERLIRYVTDKTKPVDIERFLIITYTRAAAAELRVRIMDALGKRAAENPEDKYLRRQQQNCCRAHIGTIHSFCQDVIREHSHLLGISPAFKIIEEDRAAALKSACVSRLLDSRYEHIDRDEPFRLLADTVGAGRDDKRLEGAVLTLYEKLRSHPYPADWAAAQKTAMEADGVSDVSETLWGQELLSGAAESADYWLGAMEQAIEDIYAADEKIKKAYGESFAETAGALRDFARALRSGWDSARAFLPISFPRLGALRNYENAALSERVKAVRDGCKKSCEALQKEFSQSSETHLAELRAMAPAMAALLDLTLAFDKAYTAEKRRRDCLDFSDLEHYAAQLLVHKETGAPTWIAAELAFRFQEIMVDEYQDVNAVQEMIFRAISLQQRNLFLVGDVKQSIYRFRLADPGLFLEKYHSYADAEHANPGEARRILLQENFRSRKCVLDAANLVFSNIMSEKLGELDYDEDAALRFGSRAFGDSPDKPAELVILEADAAASDEETPEKSALEARFVAQRIAQMMREQTPVYENGTPRPCRYSDFAVLLRSPSGAGSTFHRVLAQSGIPVQSAQGSGFFTSLEVTAAVNLLSLIDNPHADVPLISVLRSPVYGFSGDELSAVRAQKRDCDFYTALCAAAENGNERCQAVLRQLDHWRAIAPDTELDALVWRVCSETQLFAICAAMTDGEVRRKNLMQLFEYARSFGEGGYRSVGRFVRYLRTLAEKGMEPECAPTGDAVRIMSIHKSKGLEFPFVFLCDLARRFNKMDSTGSVLMHGALGLGPKVTDTARGIEYPGMARKAIAHRILTETLSEEMRVLYVGMTRAKEQLIMSCVWKNAQDALDKLRLGAASPAAPAVLRTAQSFSQWVAMAAMQDESILPITIVRGGEKAETAAVSAGETAQEEADEAAYAALKEKLDYVYPHAAAVSLPSKLTATEMKGCAHEREALDETAALYTPAFTPCFRKPLTAAETKLSAAQRGSATHTFLQYVDFSDAQSAEALKAQAEYIVAQGHLSTEEAAAVDYEAVSALIASPLGRRILQGENLQREFRFTLLCKAADFYDGAAEDDEVLMQGVVDCFFEENGQLILVDYKTDRVSKADLPARAEHYRGQLETYAAALQRITGKPVAQKMLYFLQAKCEYSL